jgi:hypothetical protein
MEFGLVGVIPFFAIAANQPSRRRLFDLSMGSHVVPLSSPTPSLITL